MKLNLDFYDEKIEEKLSDEEIKLLDIISNTTSFDDAIEKNPEICVYTKLSNIKENLLNWYEFKDNATGLEIGADFGEFIGLFVKKFSRVVAIENNLDKAKYIENKYADKGNLEVIVGSLDNIKINEKFDYIVVSEYLEKHDFKTTILWAKEYLKEDGTIFVAVDNKFGMKNWKGKDEYKALIQNPKINTKAEFGKTKLEKNISDLNFNSRFYYIFPEYKAPNLIYTDEHKISTEDISRNFELNDEGDSIAFKENDVFNTIVKEENDKVNFFANSFLIEISKNAISHKVKYVTFANYRVKAKQLQTIILDDKVIKRPVNPESCEHIHDMIENIKHFPKNGCMLLDRKKDDDSIESDFINGKRLDEIILESDNPSEEFDKYKEIIFQNIIDYDNINKDELLKPLKEADEELLKKMHFIEYGFLDMIPKNCFIIGGVNFFFDQEWMIKFIPAEFILFRAIRNTIGVDKEYFHSHYELNDFLELFEKTEEFFGDMLLDKNIFLKIFVRQVESKSQRIASLTNQVVVQNEIITKNESDIQGNKENIAQLEAVVQEKVAIIAQKEQELIIIGNSFSWKITKPLRAISNLIRKIFKK